MNIVIYYLSKKIILQTHHQTLDHQGAIRIDSLKKKEIFKFFELFIESNKDLLTFETSAIEKGFDKLRKTFKLIYAAGGLIKNENSYLFIYRLKKWDLPKGKLDMGESPEEAAIRECEEECGISKLSIKKELPSTYHIYKYKGGFAIKKTFWYEMTTEHKDTLVPQIEENIERVEWFNLAQIKEIVFKNTYPAILDSVKNNILVNE
ncbi:MAG: NUDIX hydrolase [Bacteroidota bacterium]|jgi:ADP-ribose pyrophosphatase YjhB (NUDIX family)